MKKKVYHDPSEFQTVLDRMFEILMERGDVTFPIKLENCRRIGLSGVYFEAQLLLPLDRRAATLSPDKRKTLISRLNSINTRNFKKKTLTPVEPVEVIQAKVRPVTTRQPFIEATEIESQPSGAQLATMFTACSPTFIASDLKTQESFIDMLMSCMKRT